MLNLSKEVFVNFLDFLNQRGFNLIEPISFQKLNPQRKAVSDLKNLYPNTQTLLLIGNGGSSLWQSFSKWHENQKQLGNFFEDPLDTYTRNCLEEGLIFFRNKNMHTKTIYPFLKEKIWIDFQSIALEMKMVTFSPLGLALHPQFGPWTSFRAMVLCNEPLPKNEKWALCKETDSWDPCPKCPAPCIQICPVQALTRTKVNHNKCIEHRRIKEESCNDRCLAREACPLTPQEIFPREEISYHYTFGLNKT